MVVLDTHVWLWWLARHDEAISSPATEAIQRAGAIAISAWTCWEIATLARSGRVGLDRPVRQWLDGARATTDTEILPVTEEIATHAGELPDRFPGDPADRTIYATAIVHAARLVTRDRAIREFDPLRTVW